MKIWQKSGLTIEGSVIKVKFGPNHWLNDDGDHKLICLSSMVESSEKLYYKLFSKEI